MDDDYANLSWMGLGRQAGEFSAMITVVNKWAINENNPPWVHPLPSIRRALLDKCSGRVFQADKDKPRKPDEVTQGDWDSFV